LGKANVRVRLKCSNHLHKKFWTPHIVIWQYGKKLTVRQPHTLIPIARWPQVFARAMVPNSGIMKTLDNFGSIIRRAIIADDNFKVLIGLLQNAVDRLA
jgi:hypothetical protein